jgi:hypothetical protein
MRMPRLVLAACIAVAGSAGAAEVASGCTGGPLRVVIEGYEPREAKLFYRVFSYDESGSPPSVHYFDLRGPRPGRAVRARSLEDSSESYRGGTLTPAAWAAQVRRLVALPVEEGFEMTVRATAASTEGSGPYGEPRSLVNVEIESGGRRGQEVVEAWCRPLVAVRGLYRIPGRVETLIVLTRIGRAYGCEEVELPVLLR